MSDWTPGDSVNLERVEQHLGRIRRYVAIFFWVWVVAIAISVLFFVLELFLSTPTTFH
jgi:hypothetical protein